MNKNIDKFQLVFDFQEALNSIPFKELITSLDGFLKILQRVTKKIGAVNAFIVFTDNTASYFPSFSENLKINFSFDIDSELYKKQLETKDHKLFWLEEKETKLLCKAEIRESIIGHYVFLPYNFDPNLGALVFQFDSENKDTGDLLRALSNVFSSFIENIRSKENSDRLIWQLKILAENVQDMLCLHNKEGKNLWISNSIFDKTGLQPEQLVGDYIFNYIHPEDIQKVKEFFSFFKAQEEEEAKIHFRWLRADQSFIYVETSKKTIFDKNGSDLYILTISRDITNPFKAEIKLKENQRMLRTLMTNLSGIVYRCKNAPNWPMEFISDGCFAITGYSSSEFVEKQMSFSYLVLKEDKDYLWNGVNKAIEENRAFELNYRIRAKSGEIKWIWEQGRAVWGEDGKIEALEGVVSDVTSLKNAELALRESKAKNEAILKALPDHLLVQSQDERIIDYYSSKSFLGFSCDMVVNKSLKDVFPPDIYTLNSKALIKVIQTRKPFNFEFKHFYKGREYFFELRMVPYEQDKTVSIIRDVTWQKVTEQSLKENEEKYRLLFSNEKDAIALFDLKSGNFIEVNDAWLDLYGYDSTEIKKLKVFDSSAEYESTLRTLQFLDNNKSLHIPSRKQKRKNGTIFYAEITSSTFILNKKKVVCSIIRDISDRVRSEEILKESEDRYRRLVEHSPLGILVIDNETIHYVNKQAVKIFGASDQNQLINLKIEKVYHPKYLSVIRKNIEKVLNNFEAIPQFETKLLRFDGKEIEVEATGIPFEINNKLAVQFIFQDVTEKKQNEQAIRETQARLETIFENIPFDFWVLDKNGKYIKQNTISFNNWGKLVDKKPENIDVAKEIAKIWKNNNKRAFKGEVVKGEVSYIVNNEEKTFFNIIAPVFVGDDIEGIFGINIDITERKRMELDLERKTTELTRINKDLENFAYIASHDLKSPVVNLKSLFSFYNKVNPLDEFNSVVLEKMEISINQLNSTLEDLLKILKLKQDKGTPSELVEFQELFHHIHATIENEIQEAKATISTEFREKSIIYPYSHLKSILQNYLVNAIKYSVPKNPPVIKVSTFRIDQYICLEVNDNGLGIDLDLYKDKVFGLYKRFHENIKGNGLGLYLVKSQVESLGGKVDVESQPGKGSTFRAYLLEQKME